MRKSSVLAASIACFSLVTAFAYSFFGNGPRSSDYDYETSIQKLRTIGAALQIYRAETGFLAPSQRRSSHDAGLPDSLTFLCRTGHAWSLPERHQTFSVAAPTWPRGRSSSPFHFTSLYVSPQHYAVVGDKSEWFARRGEQLPIYADLNMNSIQSRADPSKSMQTAIILRLNGEVEVVEYDWTGQRDILTK